MEGDEVSNEGRGGVGGLEGRDGGHGDEELGDRVVRGETRFRRNYGERWGVGEIGMGEGVGLRGGQGKSDRRGEWKVGIEV